MNCFRFLSIITDRTHFEPFHLGEGSCLYIFHTPNIINETTDLGPLTFIKRLNLLEQEEGIRVFVFIMEPEQVIKRHPEERGNLDKGGGVWIRFVTLPLLNGGRRHFERPRKLLLSQALKGS